MKRKTPSKRKLKEQRKLAAIMFTDMVGYSALTQKNEAVALELLEEHKRLLRPIFPRFNGREIKTIGDAFLVEFSSALDATRCAVEIQTKLQQHNQTVAADRILQIRIGLHVGDIVLHQKDVYGDGVNIASRIEPLARPGGICLSEDVARQIQNKIDVPLVRLGTGELKNIQLPVGIYRIVLPWERQRLPFSERVGFALKKRRSRNIAAAAAALALLAALWWQLTPVQIVEKSIAVLPFDNYGGKSEDEYFVDGMTESLITDLAKVSGLFVIARNSAFQYKGKPHDIRAVGKELNVRYVLEGSVQRASNILRVNAQLIDALTGAHVWADKFDRTANDIFAVQDDISAHIISALKVTLGEGEVERRKAERPVVMEAYDLYLKGLYHSRQRTKTDNDVALQYFRQALEKDPNYSLAHAALASALRFRYAFGFERNPNILSEAKFYTERALEINPLSSEALLNKGLIQREEGELPMAIQTLNKALAANPSDAQLHYYLGNSYRDAGYLTKALQYHARVLEFEPLYYFNSYNLWVDYWQTGKYDSMKVMAERAVNLDPTHFLSYLMLGFQRVLENREREAVDLVTKMIAAEPNHVDSYAERAFVYWHFGRFDSALADLRTLVQKDPESQTALIYALPLFIDLGKYAEAERFAEHWIRKEITPLAFGTDLKGFAYVHLGLIERLTGRRSQAARSFTLARQSIEGHLADFPESPTLRSMLGLALANLGKYDSAEGEIRKGALLLPSNPAIPFDLARVFALEGDKESMLQWVAKALELGKRDFAMIRKDVYFQSFSDDRDLLSLLESAQKKAF